MEWTVVALYAGIAVAIAGGMLSLSHILGPRKRRPEKDQTYECGVDPVGTTKERFSVHFYLVAILFILFDIETVFLIPWAVLYKKLGVPGLMEVGVFLAVLGFGLVSGGKRKGLEWE